MANTKQPNAENVSFVEEDGIKPSLSAAPAKITDQLVFLRARQEHSVLVPKSRKIYGRNAKHSENRDLNASTKARASDAQPATSRTDNAWTKYSLFGEVFEDAMLNHQRRSVGLALIIEASVMGRSRPVEITRTTGISVSRGERRELRRYCWKINAEVADNRRRLVLIRGRVTTA